MPAGLSGNLHRSQNGAAKNTGLGFGTLLNDVLVLDSVVGTQTGFKNYAVNEDNSYNLSFTSGMPPRESADTAEKVQNLMERIIQLESERAEKAEEKVEKLMKRIIQLEAEKAEILGEG